MAPEGRTSRAESNLRPFLLPWLAAWVSNAAL
jgi:hypothetical protein